MTCRSNHPVAGKCERTGPHRMHRRDAVLVDNGKRWITTTQWLDPVADVVAGFAASGDAS
jgi:hypothetical protein